MRQEEIFGRALHVYESNSYIQNVFNPELDRSCYHNVSQEVLEMKTLLLMIRRLLEMVVISFLFYA